MDQNIYCLLENIVSLRIKLEIKEINFEIKDFLQIINIDGFKYIDRIKIEDINQDNLYISLIAEEIKFNDDKQEIKGPNFIININNKCFDFIGPPGLFGENYLEIIDKMNTDGNFLLMSFYKFYSEKLDLEIEGKIIFEIYEELLIEKLNLFLNKLKENCSGFNLLKGEIGGISININKDNFNYNFFISKNNLDIRDSKRILIIIDFIQEGKMKICDFEIKKYLTQIIMNFNQILNIILR
ncbi:MAG: hypothetical protein ACTSQP_11310 [Promethearchaeota archaeon]